MSHADLVNSALTGDREAVRALIGFVAPVVQARVARALLKRRATGVNRHVRQEVLDLSQEVFAALFHGGGRILRTWDPDKGLSLANFVGLVAEREVASILRSGVRSPYAGDHVLSDEPTDPLAAPATIESDLASRELLGRLMSALTARLSPLGMRMFQLLYVEEHGVEEVCREMGMAPDAVYAWRSRLSRLAIEVRRELEPTESDVRKTSGTTKSQVERSSKVAR